MTWYADQDTCLLWHAITRFSAISLRFSKEFYNFNNLEISIVALSMGVGGFLATSTTGPASWWTEITVTTRGRSAFLSCTISNLAWKTSRSSLYACRLAC
ncbi:hypothetical protein K431DRAFT_80380 [Polychaeton citri CBS 116435]|uniref:Uncharacterized protein n=1 Tax=Polychaeton citri CBS 116435 TaxID=1314669 RepID=A0A9P4QIL8_9PEZI|nr:hypothetical protein K431DRAFT_80380 [Polychaeton citri CBS 116435]